MKLYIQDVVNASFCLPFLLTAAFPIDGKPSLMFDEQADGFVDNSLVSRIHEHWRAQQPIKHK
jgi:hypothetical protein